MQIFVDTNVFLDFYRSRGRLRILGELGLVRKSLVVTDQLLIEIRRNRVAALSETIQSPAKLIGFPDAPIMEGVQGLSELKEAAKVYAGKLEVVERALRAMLDDPSSDPVFGTLLILLEHDEVQRLSVDANTVARARARTYRGDPPQSPKKGTGGDEIHWECLLTLTDDLVVVTRDRGFLDAEEYLAWEYRQRTGRSLAMRPTISEGLKLVGAAVSADAARDEPGAHELEVGDVLRGGWTVVRVQDGEAFVRRGEQVGYLLLNPRPAERCPHCGSGGPWNGVRCLTCGMASDPYD